MMSTGWKALGSSSDFEELMCYFGNFHDACVREVHAATGYFVDESLTMKVDWKTTIHMLIQRQFRPASAIELRFEEVVALHVSAPSPGYENIIFDAAFFMRDEVVYWADSYGWTPESPGENTWGGGA